MTERLDRIEAAIEATTAVSQKNTTDIAELRATANALLQIVEVQQRNHEAIAAEIKANKEAQQREREAIAAEVKVNTDANAELRATTNALLQIVEAHQRNHEVSQRNFEISQRNFEVVMAEVRGLRTESQRILEHLFGRQQNGG